MSEREELRERGNEGSLSFSQPERVCHEDVGESFVVIRSRRGSQEVQLDVGEWKRREVK